MKTRVLIIIVIVIALMIILALTVKIKPFSDYPSNHVEELRQIPEVNMFYEKYGRYGVSVFPDGAYTYQIGFQSGISEDQWIMLKVNYRFGFPSNVFVHCTPQGIQSQYTIRDNVLEYLSEENCFNAKPQLEPEPMPESKTLQKKQQAKLRIQEVMMTDHRGNQYRIDAINEYRNEFENGYFLEQFVHSNKQNYEKDDLIHFRFGEWGYQLQECTFPKVEVYRRSYENYDSIEKISEWQKTGEECYFIDSDSNGYLIANVRHMPGIFKPHETCTIPGEYRIVASNLVDESKKEYGYYTCQQEKLIGEPQPWM